MTHRTVRVLALVLAAVAAGWSVLVGVAIVMRARETYYLSPTLDGSLPMVQHGWSTSTLALLVLPVLAIALVAVGFLLRRGREPRARVLLAPLAALVLSTAGLMTALALTAPGA